MKWEYRLPVVYFLRFGFGIMGTVTTRTRQRSEARAAIKAKLGLDRVPAETLLMLA